MRCYAFAIGFVCLALIGCQEKPDMPRADEPVLVTPRSDIPILTPLTDLLITKQELELTPRASADGWSLYRLAPYDSTQWELRIALRPYSGPASIDTIPPEAEPALKLFSFAPKPDDANWERVVRGGQGVFIIEDRTIEDEPRHTASTMLLASRGMLVMVLGVATTDEGRAALREYLSFVKPMPNQ